MDNIEREKRYDKMGVTAQELYMRQNGLCWLCPEKTPEGNVVIYCTDGKDKAETAAMLNPTFECVQCMMGFATGLLLKGAEDEGDREQGLGDSNP